MVRMFFSVALLLTAFSSASSAAIVNFQAVLTGAAAAAGVGTGSAGVGVVTATLDDVTGDFTVLSGTFANLTGLTQNAGNPSSPVHLHGLAGPNANAGILVGLSAPLGVSSGAISGSGNVGLANIAGVVAGNSYINLHTSAFPAGEIRGQLLAVAAVPEPSSLSLLGVALSGCMVYRRRRS